MTVRVPSLNFVMPGVTVAVGLTLVSTANVGARRKTYADGTTVVTVTSGVVTQVVVVQNLVVVVGLLTFVAKGVLSGKRPPPMIALQELGWLV